MMSISPIIAIKIFRDFLFHLAPYFISRKILPKGEKCQARKQDILFCKTTGGTSPVPSRSQPLRIFNLTQSCVLYVCICIFLCKLRTYPLKHPLLLQKAPCSYKTILTQDTVSREDGIPLKIRVPYGTHEWKTLKHTQKHTNKHTWLHQSPQKPV